MSTHAQFHGREPEPDADVEPLNPCITARREPSYSRPEAPSAPVCRCAAGCREIIDADARLCADCAELIVEVADAEHAASCDCLGCSAWSTATVALGGTALVWARRALA